MSTSKWLLIGGLIAIFIFAKAWVLTHPKSSAGLFIGAILLVLSEPAEAN